MTVLNIAEELAKRVGWIERILEKVKLNQDHLHLSKNQSEQLRQSVDSLRRDYEAYKAYNVSLAEEGYNKTSKVAMEAAHSVLKSLLQTSELYEKFLSSGSQGAACLHPLLIRILFIGWLKRIF